MEKGAGSDGGLDWEGNGMDWSELDRITGLPICVGGLVVAHARP